MFDLTRFGRLVGVLLCVFASSGLSALALEGGGARFPGKDPGPAVAQQDGSVFSLSNGALSASWRLSSGRLTPGAILDKTTGLRLSAPAELFSLVLRDGRTLKSSGMNVVGGVKVIELAPYAASSRLANRLPGRRVAATLATRDGALRIDWCVTLRDGGNYIRQQVVLRPVKTTDIAQVILVDQSLPEADVCGTVPGSPVVAGNVFTAFEHPISASQVKLGLLGQTRTVKMEKYEGDPECEDDLPPPDPDVLRAGLGAHHATCWLDRALPLQAGKTFTCSSVIGVTPPGQLRRGFLYYVERERAHPYRTFLHYNSWYDIGYFTPFNEKDCLDSINAFALELGVKRGVKMDSFLFDDGWDDKTRGGQWKFHSGFPNGFTPLKEAAERCGAGPGIWLSPWGGYSTPRTERLASGIAAGFETNGNPQCPLFSLSGPKYYESFHKACVEMVTKYGINQFKLDGTGSMDEMVPGSQFGSDFEAAITLIADLRAIKPDLYVNLTTGTWPSPFWLPICDSIWRGGQDHSFAATGSARQRWMTYRDADTYERVVRGGPLYPLTSVMLHGIIYAEHATRLNKDTENDLPSEIRSYFGSGTQLQEMYISHGLMTETNWNTLAQSASWSRSNASVLVDTHWVGGSPRKHEIYGWASWTPEKGILTLRNPDEFHRVYTLELDKVFELPADAASSYTMTAPFKQRKVERMLVPVDAHKPVKFLMRPYEVLVFEAVPVR